ncbi:MAG: hypothetical protein NT138_27635 [Planctomycetales bacterium]|nr:hypothetical protein [Planctomycetales bacterium]
MKKQVNRRTILGLAAGLALATRTRARAEESTTPWEWVLPSEGQVFNLNDEVKIKFTGPEGAKWSVEISRVGSSMPPEQETGTMYSGPQELTYPATQFGEGDYIIQVRSGEENYQGATVLSRSFTIQESSSS